MTLCHSYYPDCAGLRTEPVLEMEGEMFAWICRRCGGRMTRNRWGWFDHIHSSACGGQRADYLEIEL